MEFFIYLIVLAIGCTILYFLAKITWLQHQTSKQVDEIINSETTYPNVVGKGNFLAMYDNNKQEVKFVKVNSEGTEFEEVYHNLYVSQCFIAGEEHIWVKGEDYEGPVGKNTTTAFILDEKNGNVIFAKYDDGLEFREIPFKDIISVQICEDGDVVYSKSTARTIGGAVVGDLLGGPAGAVVGGLSGDSKQKKKIKKMSIKILLRNLSENCFEFYIYDSIEISSTHRWYSPLEKYANGIKDCISVVIDMEDKKSKSQDSPNKDLSVADELTKLAKLKDAGILSDEEFNAQKAKLLNL